MADFTGTTYEFPDEQAKPEQTPATTPPADEIQVEVVDDTPPEDRGREPLAKTVDEIAPDAEVAKYGEEVQARIKQLKRKEHDERRAREAAERERQAAIEYAQSAQVELERVRRAFQEQSKTVADTSVEAVKQRVVTAQEKLAAAYESGDAAEVAKWTSDLALSQAEAVRLQSEAARFASREESTGQPVQVPVQSAPQAAPLPQKTREWMARNPWFNRDPDMTSVAMSAHNRLMRNGVDPRSDEYFAEIDKRVRAAFPEDFQFSDASSSVAPPKQQNSQPQTVAAPVTRASAPRKVVLTESQVRIAKTLGVPPQEYARQVALLEKQNG